MLLFSKRQMSSRGRKAGEGSRGQSQCLPGRRPAGAEPRVGPSAARANAWCRIQGDGSAWLHSPQVAIAASLSLSMRASPGALSWEGGTSLFAPARSRRRLTGQRTFPARGLHAKWVHPWACARMPLAASTGVWGGSPQPGGVLWVTGGSIQAL